MEYSMIRAQVIDIMISCWVHRDALVPLQELMPLVTDIRDAIATTSTLIPVRLAPVMGLAIY